MSLLNGPTLCLHLGSCNVIDNAMFKPRILDLDIRKNFAFFSTVYTFAVGHFFVPLFH